MKPFIFNIPTKIIFGNGMIKEAGSIIPGEIKKIFIVSDPFLAKDTDIVVKLIRGLDKFEVLLYPDVEENPSFETINNAAEQARDFNADLVIGIGGGSSMDAAKGVAVVANNDKPIRQYLENLCEVKEVLPVICIPTTSGTGSEVTPFAVFTDKQNESKVGFSHPEIFPRTALLDPELTYSMPREVVINTGLDALAHAVEAYLSLDSFKMNDRIALECIEIVSQNLMMAALKEKEAMDKMAYASMLGGIAISHASTILPHIMGYPLTIYHQVPHGRACIILLPAYLQYLREKKILPEKLNKLESYFKTFGGLMKFLAGLAVSTKLATYGVNKSEIPEYVEKTILKGDVKISPGNIDRYIITQLYTDSM